MAWTRTLFGVAGTTVSSVFPDTFVGELQIKGPRPWVDVRAYGALPSASDATNDTAFLDALAALPSTGGVLLVPEGVYDKSATWALGTKSITMVGAGPGKSIIQMTGANDFLTGTGTFLTFDGFSIRKKSGNANTINFMFNFGNGTHQMLFNRVNVGGASTTQIDIQGVFNVSIYGGTLDAVAAGQGNGIMVSNDGAGGVSTTVYIRGTEFNNFNQAIDYKDTFGTGTEHCIFVGNNGAVRFSGGNTHLVMGNWAENAVAGKNFLVVDGTSSVNILAGANRLAGANPPSYYSLTGGAARSQLTILEGQSLGQINHTHNVARCVLRNSATQSIDHTVNTTLTWNTEDADTDAMHSTVSNTGRITVSTPGTYLFEATIAWAGNATGYRKGFFNKNGVTDLRGVTIASVHATDDTIVHLTALVPMSATDFLTVVAYQNSGVALNVQNGQLSSFSSVWVGT